MATGPQTGTDRIAGGRFYRRGLLPEDVTSTTLGEAAAYDLSWTFMGYSFACVLFIGIAEVAGGWLLLRERTKLHGVAILLPVMRPLAGGPEQRSRRSYAWAFCLRVIGSSSTRLAIESDRS